MKQTKNLQDKIYKGLAAITLLLIQASAVFSQQPTHYPDEHEPIPLTVGNVLLYIVTPVALFLIYYFYRRRKKRELQEKNKK